MPAKLDSGRTRSTTTQHTRTRSHTHHHTCTHNHTHTHGHTCAHTNAERHTHKHPPTQTRLPPTHVQTTWFANAATRARAGAFVTSATLCTKTRAVESGRAAAVLPIHSLQKRFTGGGVGGRTPAKPRRHWHRGAPASDCQPRAPAVRRHLRRSMLHRRRSSKRTATESQRGRKGRHGEATTNEVKQACGGRCTRKQSMPRRRRTAKAHN